MAKMSLFRLQLCAALARLHVRLAADERGATAIEYGIMAAGIGAAIATVVFGFGSELKTTFYDKIASLL